MTHKVGRIILPVVLAMLTATTLAFAKASTLDINKACKLGDGPTLKSGTYSVQILNQQPKPEAVFYRNGKEVAKVPVTLVNAPRKFEETEYFTKAEGGQHVMTELRLRGWTEKVILKGSSHMSNP